MEICSRWRLDGESLEFSLLPSIRRALTSLVFRFSRNEEEWNARRRLVQFWRKMEGSVIHASFAPISQADYAERAIVISCIFREETNECYVS